MHIDKIYINTHRYDLWFTRICIASVRYWYPDIPIYLIIDYSNGPINTTAFQKKWNVKVLDTNKQRYGWGFGKFEPLFLDSGEVFMVLDSDTVFAGPVLDKVKNIEADFVVDEEVQPMDKFKLLYYDPEEIAKLYPSFLFPGYSFNTGQWIGRSGVLSKKDFSDLIVWKPMPRLAYPDFFKQADQGLFNLIIHLQQQDKKVSVSRVPLMIWPDSGAADFIKFDSISQKKGDYPFVIHWAGMKFKNKGDYPRADILSFYEDFFYKRCSFAQRSFYRMQNLYLDREKKIKHVLKRYKKRVRS